MSYGSQGSPSLFPPGMQVLKHVTGRHWFGAHRNVVVCYWLETCTAEELRSLRTIYRALASEAKAVISVLHYVHENASLPVPGLRVDFTHKADMDPNSLGCVGVVLAGAGFWVSALTGFIVGVRMLLPKSLMPFRVTRDLEEMKPWFVAEHQRTTGERIDQACLDAWIEQARTATSKPS